MKHIEVVAAIILDDDHRVLATQRGYGEMKDGWEFPGGKIEAGESREEALRREIREELNVTIAIDGFFATTEHDYPTFHITLHSFLCHIVDGTPSLIEHEDARWLSKETLQSVQWLPADIDIIERLKTHLERH